MPTFEERLTLIEYEHVQLKNDNAELKKTIELQTIAIGALVSKAALERLNEKYDKMFDALIAHDRFTNEQLTELRGQQVELDGKIVGMQTEMRQRFEQQNTAMNARFEEMNRKFGHLETELSEHTTRFDRLETMLAQVLVRLPEKP
jgi:chromosome segregation ATPase